MCFKLIPFGGGGFFEMSIQPSKRVVSTVFYHRLLHAHLSSHLNLPQYSRWQLRCINATLGR